MKDSCVRRPVVAGRFYEGSRSALEKAVDACVGDYAPPADLGDLVGGIVPHAGWMFSGPTAAKVFKTLAQKTNPEVYVLLGAVHRGGVGGGAVFPRGAWATPIGQVAVDDVLASAVVEAAGGLVREYADAHEGEHSIEVQIPFIQILSPEATIVPIAVPPGDSAVSIGEAIAKVLQDSPKKAVLVASTDLTHYGMDYGLPDHGPFPGAMPWMRENDTRIIRLAESLQAEEICPEAAANHNACGAGAVAAAVSGARTLGAESGRVLEYTTSADVLREKYTERAVGYVGIVFERASD